jgi:hypothetical protein
MSDLAAQEFAALRDTIRRRAGARPLVAFAGVAVWAVVMLGVLIWLQNPLAAVVPLLVLVAAFEVVRTLHLGVERIGRYVQVFFEESSAGADTALSPPAWERTAMMFGPSLPGAGGHPLFFPVFFMATVANLLAVVLPGPLAIELGTLLVPHAAFISWMLYCDRGMRQQRSAELARFRAIKKDSPLRGS